MALTNTAPLDFTDGDTFKRVTINDPQVSPTTTAPLVSIARQNVTSLADPGWTFIANVVNVANGFFEVNVVALSLDAPAGPGEFPNETITLVYQLQ